jgi:hypothetical protein
MNDSFIEGLFNLYDDQHNNIMSNKIYLYHRDAFKILINSKKLNTNMIHNSFKNGHYSKIMNKSKSTIVYTFDTQYMLKIIGKNEAQILDEIIETYVDHLTQKESFLIPIYGLFKIKNTFFDQYIILMPNLCNGDAPVKMYDLKGRQPKNKCNSCITCCCHHNSDSTNETITDDKNLYDNINDKIVLNQNDYDVVIKTLMYDFDFLEYHSIIDYSLLIAEYNKIPTNNQNLIFRCQNTNEVGNIEYEYKYMKLAIIDFLNRYTWRKKVANWFKSWRWRESQIATISSDKYSTRIRNFVHDQLFATVQNS